MRLVALLSIAGFIVAPRVAADEAVPQCCLQDEPKKQDESKEEEVELEITVGKRPAAADMQQDSNFELKTPLSLEGVAARDRDVSTAVSRGMLYLLVSQQEDGTWKFEPKHQVREEVPKNERFFVPTATQTLNRTVTTALCCMALRAHEALAPESVRAAVEKALPYVIENAPKHESPQYAVWTWSLSIEFLIGELERTKDAELKEKISKAIGGAVDKLVKGQHGGQARVPSVLPKAVEKPAAKTEEVKKDRGYFGVTPVAEEGSELPGILISTVQRNGPASNAGLKNGDRILEINGVRITGIDHLYQRVAELPVGEPAKVKVLRGAKSAAGKRAAGMNQKDGGWGYYSWMEAATNCTATAVLALEHAKSAGFDVPETTLDRAHGYLLAARMIRDECDEVGFRYTMQDRADGLDVRASVARVAPCFFALNAGGHAKVAEVEKAIEVFVRRRGELDKVLGYPGNHVGKSYFNSAYYFMWSHYYTSRALSAVRNDAKRKQWGASIQEALLKLQRETGTWTDHEAWGQLYGTAMCLMALGELKFVTPGAYAKPLTMLERREY